MLSALLFPSFALWQAQRENPALALLPLVTVSQERVRHRNLAARTAGIRKGMTVRAARAMRPDLRVLEEDSPHLQAAWAALLHDLLSLTDIEPLALGQVLLRLEAGDAQKLAEAYGVHAGCANSREIALLAAYSSFSGSIRVVSGDEEKAFLKRLPVYFFAGLGLSDASILRLRWLGIERVGQLLAWKPQQVQAFLGSEAKVLLPYLYGSWQDTLHPYRPPESLQVLYSFEEPALEPHVLLPVLERLSEKLASKLGDRVASRLTLSAWVAGLRLSATRMAKEPLREAKAIFRLALLALADSQAQALGLDAVTLELSSLSRPNSQGSLWRTREERQTAIAAVSARYPTALLQIKGADPYSLAPEMRYRLVDLSTGETQTREVTRAPVAARDRGEARGEYALRA